MSKMCVLVTGGAGFIGRHLCRGLLDAGYDVRVLDSAVPGDVTPPLNGGDVEFLQGDVTNSVDCDTACRGVEGVFHLAAMSRNAPSLAGSEMMEFTVQQNLIGTIHVLRAAQRNGVHKVIYSASSTYYGNQEPPHIETMEPDCRTPYAFSKYLGEMACQFFDEMYDLPTMRLRYFQVCGPGAPSIGPYALVTGVFQRQEREGRPLTIHGTGSQRRDFIHVRDVVDATIRAYQSDFHRIAINVGSGVSHSIKELADRISSIQVFLSERPNDLRHTLADMQRARELLGWAPTIGFDEIIDEMLAGESGLRQQE